MYLGKNLQVKTELHMSTVTIVQTGSKPWGVLMLDTQFPRWKGDIGCPDGWPVELRYQKVKGIVRLQMV